MNNLPIIYPTHKSTWYSLLVFPIVPCYNTQFNNLDIIPICYILTNLSLFLNKISIPNVEILTYQAQVSIIHASKCLLHKVGFFFFNILKNKLKTGGVKKNYLELKFFLYFQTFFSFCKNSYTKCFPCCNVMLMLFQTLFFLLLLDNNYQLWEYWHHMDQIFLDLLLLSYHDLLMWHPRQTILKSYLQHPILLETKSQQPTLILL